jgi:hypothetical protein
MTQLRPERLRRLASDREGRELLCSLRVGVVLRLPGIAGDNRFELGCARYHYTHRLGPNFSVLQCLP